MGNPLVVNLCIGEIEERAIQSTPSRPKFWKRFVDDSFSIIEEVLFAFHVK
jgi:hypothetical protein